MSNDKAKEDIVNKVQSLLLQNQDIPFRDFQAKLIPNVDKATMIGVRTPIIRKMAKEFAKSYDVSLYLQALPHKYYEEYNFHGFLIETIKDFDKAVKAIDDFLPYVDNWATCDLVSPKVFKKHPTELLPHINRWISSDKVYTIRFGIEMLMAIYLDENFSPELPSLVATVKSTEYYVNMMIAWYFATALAKQYDSIIPFIQNNTLDVWTHNKAIQKAIESYRITDEQKTYLRSLKIKTK